MPGEYVMKELCNVPELENVTFVQMEELAAGYLDGYARVIGGTTRSGGIFEGDVDIPIPGAGGEGTP